MSYFFTRKRYIPSEPIDGNCSLPGMLLLLRHKHRGQTPTTPQRKNTYCCCTEGARTSLFSTPHMRKGRNGKQTGALCDHSINGTIQDKTKMPFFPFNIGFLGFRYPTPIPLPLPDCFAFWTFSCELSKKDWSARPWLHRTLIHNADTERRHGSSRVIAFGASVTFIPKTAARETLEGWKKKKGPS